MTVLEFAATCIQCAKPSFGRLHFDGTMKLADSDGGLLFDDGWTCHNCLGEPWSSADMTVEFS